ncbi:hypothetical protein I5U59_13950 [Stenotrophomonas maltophilia]|uniref:hypothetical protein n=2 Tax=Bacteria TaxID=2 RepID=UPI0006AA11DE|nr:hypothetical protein [Stenotrophomonas maltophilia]ALA81703.1 hypothetical protein VN11_06220 [Stenotrophomonas maltophilia]MBH1478976.1 hypothetical protein [Stenotrophomonas maltophilia]MBH1504173.1 hypothetical protein [Stenotrophomonas maltophilia]MBH1787924.1 hypothetical protein [Stenotrophomonas maltophilia]
MKRSISSRLQSLLIEIAAKHNFQLSEEGFINPVELDRELLINALVQELLETGLGADDEPNQRGLEIEEIIDFVVSISGPPDARGG